MQRGSNDTYESLDAKREQRHICKLSDQLHTLTLSTHSHLVHTLTLGTHTHTHTHTQQIHTRTLIDE